tara:strand:- start:738 stop:1148 length:411 start_codon:yes stop_codon:yes gene_type:complete
MNDDDKNKLYILTALLDSGLIYILAKKNLHFIDKSWIYAVLSTHGLFYYSLRLNKRKLLDILHYLVFVLPVFSLFTKTIYPKILSLFLVIIIQYLWVIENRCILNENGQSLGFGSITSIATITLNTLLSFQIGKFI